MNHVRQATEQEVTAPPGRNTIKRCGDKQTERSNSDWEHAPRVKGTGTVTMRREGDDDAGKAEWSWIKTEIPGRSTAGQHGRDDHSALEVAVQDGPKRNRESTTDGQNWDTAKLPIFDKTYKPPGPRSCTQPRKNNLKKS